MKMKRILTFIAAAILVFAIMPAASAADFTDVPDSHPYRVAIDYCKTNGFVKGVSDTMFMPAGELTRAQLSAIWCRTLQINDTNHKFMDLTPLTRYYDTASIIMHGFGIIQGTSDSDFSPEAKVTREQLALITMRTFDLGVADKEAYKQYDDAADISPWARDGVSACLNAGVLEGLYAEQKFDPTKYVTRAEICKIIFNVSVPKHDVIIETLSGGSITANPTSARAGETITLTISPLAGKRLKAGTLKYGTTDLTATDGKAMFVMPDSDVTVTADFEDKPVLESISVTGGPTKKTYTKNETLDLSGLVVTASYSDGSTPIVTGYTTDPAGGAVLGTTGDTIVTVSYTDADNTTKETTFTVMVNAAA